MLKSELFDLCSRFAVKPEFLIDRIARKEVFSKVTNKTCQKLIEKVNLQEEAFWTEDTDKAI